MLVTRLVSTQNTLNMALPAILLDLSREKSANGHKNAGVRIHARVIFLGPGRGPEHSNAEANGKRPI